MGFFSLLIKPLPFIFAFLFLDCSKLLIFSPWIKFPFSESNLEKHQKLLECIISIFYQTKWKLTFQLQAFGVLICDELVLKSLVEIHCSWSALPKSLKAVLPKSVRNSAVLHLFVGFSDYFEVVQGAKKGKRLKETNWKINRRDSPKMCYVSDAFFQVLSVV